MYVAKIQLLLITGSVIRVGANQHLMFWLSYDLMTTRRDEPILSTVHYQT